MRILRIALRNFRGVAAGELRLPPDGVTVVEGPNEIGKSSFAEAVDLIFTYPDRSNDGRVKAVKPVHADVGAEVEVELTLGPYHAIYSKRWHKQQQTVLRLLAPEAKQLTGREAHDRMVEILDECLDRALWGALRWQQGSECRQAEVRESRSLLAALDAAAGGGGLADGGEAEDLWTRVGKERGRYFTAGGKPTGEREKLAGAVKKAQTEVDRLEAELAALDADVEKHHRLQQELSHTAGQLAEQKQNAEERETEWNAVRTEQLKVAAAATALEKARAAAEKAITAADERLALVEQLRVAEEEVARLVAEAERAAPGLEAATATAADARSKREEAREAQRRADEAALLAEGDLEHLRSLFNLELLGERHARVLEAETEQAAALSFLERCHIDDARLEEIEQAFVSEAKARTLLEAEAAAVCIEALTDTGLELDGRERSLATGEIYEGRVSGTMEITLPGQIRMTVTSGAGARDLEERAAEARQHLHDLYAAAGVSGDDPLAMAREQERRRRSALQQAEQATRVLAENLRDLTPQGLAEMIERTRRRAQDYEASRTSSVPLPEDRDAAKAAKDQADEHQQLCRDSFEQRDAELEKAVENLRRLEEDARERSVYVQIAGEKAAALAQGLAEARAAAPDDQVAAAAVEAEGVAAEARSTHQAAEAALEERNPGQAEELAQNARSALAGLERRRQALEVELGAVAAVLKSQGEAGLQEQIDAARSGLVQLEGQKERTDRRAAAANLLYRVLEEHRDAARRAYVDPLRQQLERLGRIVFGPDLAITLDPASLSIKERTLGGKTVPFESLSVGAKEQLSLLGRLACALLVSRPDGGDAGVPLLIDDALGNSDVERLERLGAVLAVAGRQTQVVVLTCMPDRYRHIGSARVIRLPGSGQAEDGDGDGATAITPQGAQEPGTEPPAMETSRRTDDWEAKVLACLGAASAPMGKSEIVVQSGMPESLWQATINSLMAQGKVSREGVKRGTRYRLV